MSIKSRLQSVTRRLGGALGLDTIIHEARQTREINKAILANLFLRDFRAFCESFQDDAKPIAADGARYFSQNGEDGMIDSIFDRLGSPLSTFIEIGVGSGLENNTLYQLHRGARGVWVEGSEKRCRQVADNVKVFLESGQLQLVEQWVDRANIDALVTAHASGDLDMLSIDIDGNDYWVWRAIKKVKPKLLVIEFNGSFGPTVDWVMAYNPDHAWTLNSNYFGASLKAMERLGRQKGYSLVGCDYMGVNAFFVRDDLIEDKFNGPFSSEAIFIEKKGGTGRFPRAWTVELGPFERSEVVEKSN